MEITQEQLLLAVSAVNRTLGREDSLDIVNVIFSAIGIKVADILPVSAGQWGEVFHNTTWGVQVDGRLIAYGIERECDAVLMANSKELVEAFVKYFRLFHLSDSERGQRIQELLTKVGVKGERWG